MDGGAWWAAVHGVTESWTRLSDFTFIFHFHALEKDMASHSSVLAWRIPGMAEPGGLPSMGSHRVGHDWSDLAAAAATQVTFAFYRYVKMRVWSEASDHLHMWMNSCIFNRRPVGSPPYHRGGAQVSRFQSWHPLDIVTTTAAFEKAVWSSQRMMFRNRPARQIPSRFCISLFHGQSRKGKKDIKKTNERYQDNAVLFLLIEQS